MKKRWVSRLLVITLAAGILSSCGVAGTDWRPIPHHPSVQSETLTVERVENLPRDFILGMDASCVPALEAGGVRYSNHGGEEQDVFQILRDNGINYIRVRVWNDPFDGDGHGYGGGNCDIENALRIGRRATEAGLNLLVNFHYSDFWADPGKQMVPKAWQNMPIEEKSDALYRYTKESLTKLIDAGVDVGMVQIGNESNGFMCGETDWANITRLMSAGSRAVREVCPGALTVLHFTNPEKVTHYAEYGRILSEYDVDYDVFASSYYPYWHGTMDNLAEVLSHIAETYGKKVMVAETSYAYTAADTDYYGNTIGPGAAVAGYPLSMQGQADLVRDVIDTVVNKTANGIGVFYWEGTWIAAGGDSYGENRTLWEKYGSGWASSHAAEYDPKDAGKWYGGCAVDNQAFFDGQGKALESLKIFALLREGNTLTDQ